MYIFTHLNILIAFGIICFLSLYEVVLTHALGKPRFWGIVLSVVWHCRHILTAGFLGDCVLHWFGVFTWVINAESEKHAAKLVHSVWLDQHIDHLACERAARRSRVLREALHSARVDLPFEPRSKAMDLILHRWWKKWVKEERNNMRDSDACRFYPWFQSCFYLKTEDDVAAEVFTHTAAYRFNQRVRKDCSLWSFFGFVQDIPAQALDD